ncbi:MAG: hypothetical protein A3F41_04795 [Coxiella sp. RIFCSPHIGHO2_12_FULL_44_14]|nr:MAG: hypothetical protein A3F41_04795 [Coxiella sp. RIFCSPHIGHO2_12_FULL_44_14]
MQSKKYINWTNTLFLILTPLVGIIGTLLLCLFSQVALATWIFAGIFTFITGMGITAGYHRLLSHKTYQCHGVVRLFLLLFSSACFEGSALEWSTDHRNHHRYVDTDKDPYSIHKGFWFAHIGWLIRLEPKKRDFSNVADLMRDPLVRFQHRFFVPLAILMGFIFPLALGALWGDALGGLLIAGALRIVFNHHVTFAINSICHTFGKRTYCLKQTAVDNWFTALFTYGEGYHSYHHKFPIDYRNGIKTFHYDPTKWLIRLLAWMGLAYNLKKISQHRILKQQVMVKELQLQEKIAARLLQNKPQEQWLQLTETLRHGMQQVLQKIEQLEIHYLHLYRKRKDPSSPQDKPCRSQLKACRKHIKQSYMELKAYLSLWRQLQRQFHRCAFQPV